MDDQQNLAARVAALETTVMRLLKEFLPPVTARLEALEGEQGTLSKTAESKKHTRKPMTYEVYLDVKRLYDQGVEEKQIAQDLDIPYSTVRAYLTMPPTKRARLQLKYEARLQTEETTASPSEVSPSEGVASGVTPSEDVTAASFEENTPVSASTEESSVASRSMYEWQKWTEAQRKRGDPPCGLLDKVAVITMLGERVTDLAKDIDWGRVCNWMYLGSE